jgi:hypothetical protein
LLLLLLLLLRRLLHRWCLPCSVGLGGCLMAGSLQLLWLLFARCQWRPPLVLPILRLALGLLLLLLLVLRRLLMVLLHQHLLLRGRILTALMDCLLCVARGRGALTQQRRCR